MRTNSMMRAVALVTTAVLALGASSASANAHGGTPAPTEATVESTASTEYEQSLTAEDGTVVTFKLDVESQTLTVSNSRGDREVVSVSDEVIEDLTADAATTPGTISAQGVSVETCKNLLSAAGYANGIVWTLATIAAAPTVAGSLVGAGAGLITTAMITEAGRLCK